MTHEDVMQMLAETEIPFAYDHFAEGESPDPPFICFLFPGSENFAADNVVYMEFSNLSIELYTDEKDPELEDRVDSTVEPEHFALLFEFSGDKKKIRHCMYYCTAARPTIEGKTNEDSKEVQTESLEITATPLPSGLVKVKTGANTTDEVYNGWYSAVYQSPTTEPTEQGQG